ncbi:hypothetical protein ACJX0J_019015, partial [Zea mays]
TAEEEQQCHEAPVFRLGWLVGLDAVDGGAIIQTEEAHIGRFAAPEIEGHALFPVVEVLHFVLPTTGWM